MVEESGESRYNATRFCRQFAKFAFLAAGRLYWCRPLLCTAGVIIVRTQRETRRLRFEQLEDRRLLAVYTVSTTANSGAGSLREAITQANATQVADEIVFAPELSGATIELSGSQLNISNNLVIDATALPAGVTIDGNRSTRLFWIEPVPASVQLRGLTMTGARAPGGEGAIVNYGTLIVDACRFVDNDDVAIWNGRNVTISHSFFLPQHRPWGARFGSLQPGRCQNLRQHIC
jgi:hypothetical protein